MSPTVWARVRLVGSAVLVWRLGTGPFHHGRLGATESDLAVDDADHYRRRRLRGAAAGTLAVTAGHPDLLVLP